MPLRGRDILWVHIWDRHTPLEETLRALDDAVSTGKLSGAAGSRVDPAAR
ncbi:aldo/keto reductase [Nocardia xishanensis]